MNNSNEKDDLDLDSILGEGEEPQTDGMASIQGALSALPVQAAPYTGKNALTVKRGPGRPRKVERMPTTSDLEYHALMTAEKQKLIDQDPLVGAVKSRQDPMDILHLVKQQIAEETAALRFQRIENEKHGKDTASISSRRIDSLKKVADIELEMKKLGADSIDLRSEKFQRVFKFFIEQIQTVAEEVLPREHFEIFFNKLESALEGWEDRATDSIK